MSHPRVKVVVLSRSRTTVLHAPVVEEPLYSTSRSVRPARDTRGRREKCEDCEDVAAVGVDWVEGDETEAAPDDDEVAVTSVSTCMAPLDVEGDASAPPLLAPLVVVPPSVCVADDEDEEDEEDDGEDEDDEDGGSP